MVRIQRWVAPLEMNVVALRPPSLIRPRKKREKWSTNFGHAKIENKCVCVWWTLSLKPGFGIESGLRYTVWSIRWIRKLLVGTSIILTRFELTFYGNVLKVFLSKAAFFSFIVRVVHVSAWIINFERSDIFTTEQSSCQVWLDSKWFACEC